MKTLILFLLSSAPVFAANNVSVVIDGENYSCTRGGSGGSSCDCRIDSNGSYFSYMITYKGDDLKKSATSYYTKVDALGECKTEIKTIAACN